MRISRASFRTNSFSTPAGVSKLILALLFLAGSSSLFANTVLLAGDPSTGTLRWKPGPIRIAVSSSLLRESPNIKHDSDVTGAIRRSIESWSRVSKVDIQFVTSDKLSASPAGPAGDGVSLITIAQTPENVLLFAKDPEGSAATTRIFYNRRGLISEADIVLNPFQQFSTDGTIGTFDLESTLTHEIGHLLGLPHSEVLGSTMHANYGKNGVFGLQRLTARTLSAADIAALRSIYGAKAEDPDCCGSIDGRLTVTGRSGRTLDVWIEDLGGRVYGSVRVGTNGEFSFGGLTGGRYRLLVHEPGRARNAVAAQEIAVASVAAGETTMVTSKISPGTSSGDLELTYLGFNGQLSEMAVSLSAGRAYTVYLGGRNLDAKDTTVSFSSADLAVTPGTIRSLDYGDGISVIAFEVRVSRRARIGDYTVFVESPGAEKRAIIGGLTVDRSANSWVSFAGFDD